jgi:succinyl-CoA synthetase beta subunit
VDLLEYQAKELFREIGIPVLPSQRIENPREIKGLQLPYPVVLKSQVRVGGRGRSGGVRFVENTIDAIAAARTIFNLPILGEYPKVLLAEAKYDAERELYLAVVLDYTAKRPVLLGSAQGGINAEAVMQHMRQVVVDEEFSPFYGRHLAIAMGLQGKLIQSVSTIVEKMYQLFVQKDLDLVEINPLGVSTNGEVMALDGKIAVNDEAIARHQDLELVVSKIAPAKKMPSTSTTELRRLHWLSKEGSLGIVCNDTSLAIATLDLALEAKGKPSECLILSEATPTLHSQQLESALEQLFQSKNIKAILVNMLGNPAYCEEIATVIGNYLQQQVEKKPAIGAMKMPHLVVRLVGGKISLDLDRFPQLSIHAIDNLDEAIAQAIVLAKPTAKSS